MIVPVVAVIIALALYPQFVLKRSETAVDVSLPAPQQLLAAH